MAFLDSNGGRRLTFNLFKGESLSERERRHRRASAALGRRQNVGREEAGEGRSTAAARRHGGSGKLLRS
jgi:hypothetical protein